MNFCCCIQTSIHIPKSIVSRNRSFIWRAYVYTSSQLGSAQLPLDKYRITLHRIVSRSVPLHHISKQASKQQTTPPLSSKSVDIAVYTKPYAHPSSLSLLLTPSARKIQNKPHWDTKPRMDLLAMHELGMDGTGKLGGAGFACLFVCFWVS